MKYKLTLSGSKSSTSHVIEPGESLEIPLTWLDASGSPISPLGHSVTCRIYSLSPTRTLVTTVAQTDPTVLSVPGATTTTLAPGTYHVEIVDTNGPVISSGSFTLVVAP